MERSLMQLFKHYLLLLTLVLFSITLNAADGFTNGTGTLADPYQITTPEELNHVRNYPAAAFKLMNDLDLTAYASGAGWLPIGSATTIVPFTGNFNGNGKTVKNLTINRPNETNIALFAVGNGGVKIKDLKLFNCKITGSQRVGALLGSYGGDSIRNCQVTGILNTTSSNYGACGGLIGFQQGGEINDCSAEVQIKSLYQVGGLVGYAQQGHMTNCFATGIIISNEQTGGLVGQAFKYAIKKSYSDLHINSAHMLGGLIGRGTECSISECYAAGLITGVAATMGGLIGYPATCDVQKCYWNKETTKQTSSYGTDYTGIDPSFGLTSEQMRSAATFVNWDFANTWDIKSGTTISYPYFKNILPIELSGLAYQVSYTADANGNLSGTSFNSYVPAHGNAPTITATPVSAIYKFSRWSDGSTQNPRTDLNVTAPIAVQAIFTPAFAGGDGSINNPYQITSEYELGIVRNFLNANFILKNDIPLNLGTITKLDGWLPLGDAATPFSGSFNGNGKKINGFRIDRATTDYVGLFGVVAASGNISNLTVNGVNVIGKGYVGGVVGKNFGSLSCCAFNGAVNGDMWTGGLVGWNEGEINQCYSTGSAVSNQNTAGGLVGQNQKNISNCYSMATVDAFDFAGGLVGHQMIPAMIYYCYAAGKVTNRGDQTRKGGILGFAGGTVSYSYWDTETSGLNSSCNSDPVFGLFTMQMKSQNSFNGWNFNNCWQIVSGTSVSYPYLANNLPTSQPGIVNVFTLAYTTDGHGAISGSATQTVAANGSGSSVTAVANPGFKFLNWSDNSTTNPRTDTNVTANLNLMARFASVFSAGSGTTDDPYQIVTAADFNNIRLFSGTAGTDVHFKLMNDLDLSDYLTSGEGFTAWGADGWLPIGSSEQKFCACFDGNLFKISGLKIKRPTSANVGLWGYLDTNGEIKNLGVEIADNDTVSGGNSTAILVGCLVNSAIANCYVQGTVKGINNVGGLVGYSYGGSISSSCAKVSVTGNDFVGGLIGLANMVVTNSYAQGSVTGNSSVGGLTGKSSYQIKYCYSNSAVTGVTETGGLLGTDDAGSYTSCYWDLDQSGQATSPNPYGGISGKTTAEMKLQSTYSTWDFTSIWSIAANSNNGYPYLKWQPIASTVPETLIPLPVILVQNYPNPFNPVTSISYQLAAMSNVQLAVYNAKGELVKTLVNDLQNAGRYSVNFDGAAFNSGVYFYKLEADGKNMVKRMLLVK